MIPTDEEIVIARDTYNIVREHQAGSSRWLRQSDFEIAGIASRLSCGQ